MTFRIEDIPPNIRKRRMLPDDYLGPSTSTVQPSSPALLNEGSLVDSRNNETDGANAPSLSKTDGANAPSLSKTDGANAPSLRRTNAPSVSARIPHGRQALAVLAYLISSESRTSTGRTEKLTKQKISEDLQISFGTIKTVINRLLGSGSIQLLEYKRGPGGHCIYTTTSHTKAYVNANKAPSVFLAKAPSVSEPITTATDEVPAVRSSSYRSTTTDIRELAEHLQRACDRYGLSSFQLGANDLLRLVREELCSLDNMIESLDHLAFYLSSPAAAGIKSPKAWILTQLKQGYYAPPSGFTSHQQRQIEARNKAKRDRLEQLCKSEREEFELDFEIWCREQGAAALRKRLSPPLDDPMSPAGKAALRDFFCTETNRVQPQAA